VCRTTPLRRHVSDTHGIPSSHGWFSRAVSESLSAKRHILERMCCGTLDRKTADPVRLQVQLREARSPDPSDGVRGNGALEQDTKPTTCIKKGIPQEARHHGRRKSAGEPTRSSPRPISAKRCELRFEHIESFQQLCLVRPKLLDLMEKQRHKLRVADHLRRSLFIGEYEIGCNLSDFLGNQAVLRNAQRIYVFAVVEAHGSERIQQIGLVLNVRNVALECARAHAGRTQLPFESIETETPPAIATL